MKNAKKINGGETAANCGEAENQSVLQAFNWTMGEPPCNQYQQSVDQTIGVSTRSL